MSALADLFASRQRADLRRAISLELPYPPSLNEWKTPHGRRMVETAVFRAYKRDIRWIARGCGLRHRIGGRIGVLYVLYPQRPLDAARRISRDGALWDDTVRCLDLDNAVKVVLDALKELLFDDDAFVHELHGYRAEPDGKKRLLLRIAPLLMLETQDDEFRSRDRADLDSDRRAGALGRRHGVSAEEGAGAPRALGKSA